VLHIYIQHIPQNSCGSHRCGSPVQSVLRHSGSDLLPDPLSESTRACKPSWVRLRTERVRRLPPVPRDQVALSEQRPSRSPRARAPFLLPRRPHLWTDGGAVTRFAFLCAVSHYSQAGLEATFVRHDNGDITDRPSVIRKKELASVAITDQSQLNNRGYVLCMAFAVFRVYRLNL
jgi:hypothetical protein